MMMINGICTSFLDEVVKSFEVIGTVGIGRRERRGGDDQLLAAISIAPAQASCLNWLEAPNQIESRRRSRRVAGRLPR